MFANFDLSLFPIVIVDFNNSDIDDQQFDLFLNNWESLYQSNKNFTLVFDTSNMSIPNLKYCLKMSIFIKKIRNFNPQYLEKSIIIVKNRIISNMIELVFYLQPPVAPVYLTDTSKDMIMEKLYRAEGIDSFDMSDINVLQEVQPDKPFLSFL